MEKRGNLEESHSSQREPWRRLLEEAAPRDHIVQLYQDQNFLNRAVCRFAAAALANGEGVILVPTAAHWKAFCPRLEAEGVDLQAVQRNGQLTIVESDHLLPQFMRDGMPDAPVFLGLAADVVERSRAKDRYPKVRWWGEMVNVLWLQGNATASMALEDLFHQLAHQQDIAIFCSFLMDNFDGDVHARMLPRMGENHSHLIPVEDYQRLESAVTDTLRETVGADEARVLEERLLQGYPSRFNMPRSQALLVALAQALPVVAEAVRKGTRTRYAHQPDRPGDETAAMAEPVFFIPTSAQFWTPPRDRIATREEQTWAEIEAKRTVGIAARLFPRIRFELCASPPPSQNYEPGSLNAQIRSTLEERTSIRL